jgi:FAD synthetase
MKKVMVFGVFDGVHEGHRHFLREARALGDYLVVVIAQDHIVEHLKGHAPKLDMSERFLHLRNEDNVDEIIIGDHELSTWEVVKTHQPDIIAIGYDQRPLKEDLERHHHDFNWHIEIKEISAYEPNIYHSSLLKGDEGE